MLNPEGEFWFEYLRHPDGGLKRPILQVDY